MLSTTWTVEISTISFTPEVTEMESNYRVLWNEDELYMIIEVYYDADGNIEDWDDSIIPAIGADFEELAAEIQKMAEALELPCLYIDEAGELVELEVEEEAEEA
jgi:hypothetical protein